MPTGENVHHNSDRRNEG